MADEPADFWPDDIAIDALSPAMIFNQQSEMLARKTKGLIHGELVLEESDQLVKLYFDLVATAASFRHRLLIVRYGEAVYPAVLTAMRQTDFPEHLNLLPSKTWGVNDEEKERSRVAFTPEEFEELFKSVINSKRAKASVLSLIAKSNETKFPPRFITNRSTSTQIGLNKE